MTIPFACVFVVFLLIYAPRVAVVVALARLPEGMDNKHPRDQQAKLTGWPRRANAAHNNTIEAFPPFAAAVVVAHLAHADPGWSSILAVSFVIIRMIYPILYVANVDRLRSTVWILGLFATAGLFVLPWLH
jgi:uncharacterized MAPEG superfamily protein